MKCPYCISEIHADALVCAVCRRDLYLLKPLLERVELLEAKLALSSAELADGSTEKGPSALDAAAAPERINEGEQRSVLAALAWWLLPLLLLLAGHWLMVFLYDLKVVYLRVFALLLPLPFGYLFARALRLPFAWGLLPAFVMAGLAVLGMSGVTALIDNVPVLPQSVVEIRDFLEFVVSIGLSFTTGLWLHHWLARRQVERLLLLANRARMVDGRQVTESLTRLNDIGSALVAFATTAISIYTGLKGLAG